MASGIDTPHTREGCRSQQKVPAVQYDYSWLKGDAGYFTQDKGHGSHHRCRRFDPACRSIAQALSYAFLEEYTGSSALGVGKSRLRTAE